jgi:AcrR family transcriptional regulator
MAEVSARETDSVGLPPGFSRESDKNQILVAMAELVAEQGYAATTVTAVARKAGVSRHVFYGIFASKEACLLEAYDLAAIHAAERFHNAYEPPGPLPDRVGRALEAALAFWAAEPAFAKACIVEVQRIGPVGTERREDSIGQLARFVDALRAKVHGIKVPSRPSPVAHAIAGGIYWTAYTHVVGGRVEQLPALADDLMAAGLGPLVA